MLHLSADIPIGDWRETVPPEARGGNGFIIRLCEAERRREWTRFALSLPVASVNHCDLLENAQTGIPIVEDTILLNLRPFEIVAIRCAPA